MGMQRKIQLSGPQYLHDTSGNKSFVVLTVNEYNRLIGLLNETGISEDIRGEKKKNRTAKHISGKTSADFYGIFKSENPEFVKQITEDKEADL